MTPALASLLSLFPPLVVFRSLRGCVVQAVREQTLARFRDGSLNCLIATDVASRGLDIPEVDVVVHCGAPQNADTFQHRSGRTGRAGRLGTNIVLFSPRDNGWSDVMTLQKVLVGVDLPYPSVYYCAWFRCVCVLEF